VARTEFATTVKNACLELGQNFEKKSELREGKLLAPDVGGKVAVPEDLMDAIIRHNYAQIIPQRFPFLAETQLHEFEERVFVGNAE